MSLNLDKTTWQPTRLGDVVTNVNETIREPESAGIDRIIALEHLDPGELHIDRWGDFADGTTFTKRVRPGQTLFAKRRAYQRKAAYAEFDAIASGDILTLTANPDKILPELLPFLVQSDLFYGHAIRTSAGSLSPRTNWRDLAKLEFMLPPVEEQHRIADLLWAIEQHDQSLAALRSRSGALVSAAGDASVWASGAGEALLADVLASCSYGSSARADYQDGLDRVPILRIPNVVHGEVTIGDLKFVSDSEATASNTVDEGDLLVVRTNGNPDYVSRAALAPELDRDYTYASYLLRIRADPDTLRSDYLFEVWETPTMKRRLAPWIRSSAGNFNLSASSIMDLTIPLPPLARQEHIAADLHSARAPVRAIDADRHALHNLRTAVLGEVFG